VEVAREELGDLRHVDAAFSFRLGDGPDVRLDPDLAGGALMDVGCYPVNAARTFLGEPVLASAHTHDRRGSGVDTEIAAALEFEDGATATVEAGFETREHQTCRVEGTDGWLEAESAFNPGVTETVLRWGTDEKTVEETFDPVDAYRREVEHFAASVDAGRDPLTDGEEAVANMRAIDALYEAAATGESVPL
jgi:predicted dehydrogenase